MTEYNNENNSEYSGRYSYEYDEDGWKRVPYEAYESMPKKKRPAWKGILAGVLALAIAAGAAAGGVYYAHSFTSSVKNKVTASAAAESTSSAKNASAKKASDLASSQAGSAKFMDLSTSGGTVVVTDVTNVVEKAMPSIVSVFNNYTSTYNYWGMTYSQEATATGSGIIIAENDEELLIVTNNHVVSGEESLEVQFIDLATVEAQIKGTDRANDLAVITVSKADLEPETLEAISVAEIGDSDILKVGEPAIAIGNALGYGQSVTVGVVSALNRKISSSDGSEATFIQTDAAINQGNSGGALLNIYGEVIGINSNKIGGSAVEGMGYAIPISRAVPIIEKLMGQGTKESAIPEDEQGTLGISGASVTAEVSMAYDMPVGVYIAQILADGAAEEAGLQKGDIITDLNGSTIETMEDLKEQLSYYRAGEEVSITIMRSAGSGEYEEIQMDITLSDRSVISGASGSSGGRGRGPAQGPGQNAPEDGNEGGEDAGENETESEPFQFNRGE